MLFAVNGTPAIIVANVMRSGAFGTTDAAGNILNPTAISRFKNTICKSIT